MKRQIMIQDIWYKLLNVQSVNIYGNELKVFYLEHANLKLLVSGGNHLYNKTNTIEMDQ